MALQFELYDRNNNSFGDISSYVLDKAFTRRLNRPSTARGRVPSRLVPELGVGNRAMKVRLNGNIKLNGIVWFLQDSGDENTQYTEFIVVDPMIWWKYRFARDPDGDLSLPSFMKRLLTGPQIIQEIGQTSNDFDGQLGMDFATGTFETAGSDVSGAPVEWPMTIGDIATLMTDTGLVDIVIDPVDDSDGYAPHIMAKCSAYNGLYGSNLSSSISFDYWQGNNNVKTISRTLDMATICNALIYYLGPKQSAQRWRANILYPGVNLPDPPQSALNALINTSRSTYGKFQDIRIYDQMESDYAAREMYYRLWQTEALLRVGPRELINVTPIRGYIPSFDVGDIVSVSASSALRGGFSSSQQRIYEYTIEEDNDGVLALGELVTSADQES